jgi:pimeloyl-ACP methyl ester carboxylesterase
MTVTGLAVNTHLWACRHASPLARACIEREVAQPDLHERVEDLLQRREQRRHRRLIEAADLFNQLADLRRFVYRGAGHIPYATHPDDYVATVLAFISCGAMF